MTNLYNTEKWQNQRIASSVICMLCAVIITAGMMGCMPEDQISEPLSGVGTSSANAGTDSEPQIGATPSKRPTVTKPQTANTTEIEIEETEPLYEDLPIYVIESGIVWYGGGYSYGDSVKWGDKWLEDSLWWAIRDTESDDNELKYAVEVVLYPDDQYQYNGKTLAEYESDAFKERAHPGVLEELLKVGDQLKYGELLYTTGTPNHTPGDPDGELWAKELYDQTVEYFGEELLAKYIVDGEFLREQVIADMKTPVPTVAKDALREARIAYLDGKFQIMREYLTGLDIEGEIFTREKSDFVPKYMIIFVTKEQLADLSFESFGIDHENDLEFCLVSKNAYSSESVGDL